MIKKRLIKLLGKAFRHVIGQSIWQVVGLLCQVVITLCAATILGGLIAKSGSIDIHLVIVAFVCIAIRFLSDRMSVRESFKSSSDVKRILRDKIFEKLLRLGNSYREHVRTSEIVQMAGEGVEQLEVYFGKYLSQFFYAMTAPVILFLCMIPVDVKAGVVLLICVPLIPVVIMVVMKVARKLLDKYFTIYYGLGDSFLENLNGMTTLKIYQADGRKAREMDHESERFRKVTMKVLSMQLNSTIIMDIVAYGGAALGMIVGFSEFALGKITVTGMIFLILIAAEFFLPMRTLGSYFHIGMNGMKASDRIFDFLDLPEPVHGNGVISSDEINIDLRDVRFSYDGEKEVLHRINMTFPAGGFVSIVGESGCGKSTISAILAGRNKGYRGHVLINGEELSDISEKSLLEKITLVSHDNYLFKGTVRDNLLMGNQSATEEQMKAALDEVNLSDVSLDYELTDNASNLSGGQRQRLSIARALLKDSPVYIFDEATSNIDMESEQMIMDAIRRVSAKRTVILISHRLANVTDSDCIYVMADGNIVEAGIHEVLLQNGRTYASLYNSQSELENYSTSTGEAAEHITIEQPAHENREPSGHEEKKKRRSALSIMGRLMVLVKSLMPVMCLAVAFGVLGFLCAIFLTITASRGIMQDIKYLPIILILMAVLRGVLHYAEQYCNHFIAFKLLAIIRHKVFAALRKLCPAKLEGKDRGSLITMITSDIELLEVFYAHTISPIMIAVITSIIMVIFIGHQALAAALIATAGYIVVGVVIPFINGRLTAESGVQLREALADLNSFVLAAVYGLDETIQFGYGEQMLSRIDSHSREMASIQQKNSRQESVQRSVMNLVIQLFSWVMLLTMGMSQAGGDITSTQMLLAAVAMMGSFGPVIALSNLSNTLNQTLACGDRVLSLLDETPEVEEVPSSDDGQAIDFDTVIADEVSFTYDDEQILSHLSLDFPSKKIIGIHGPSGCGKSTLLKLLMRFWDVTSGTITFSGKNIREIPTNDLRCTESYVTQDTWLFHDTIANNISLGDPDATMDEIQEAAKKASVHDFIMTLPDGYDTQVGELGDTLSGGQKQRIGIARAFLHKAPLILLDEPTSNLDSLNEGVILKSVKETVRDQTIVIVSHRLSTLGICDRVYSIEFY